MVTQQFEIPTSVKCGPGRKFWAPTMRGEVHVNTGDTALDQEIGGWLRDVYQRIVERMKSVERRPDVT